MPRAVADAAALAPERPAAALSRTTLMTLRRVLHAYREGWLLDGRLAAAARMVAEDARGRRLAAERMLVALKHQWAALQEVRAMSPRDARDVLGRLTTLSIRAYYQAAPHQRGADAPDPRRPAGAHTVA